MKRLYSFLMYFLVLFIGNLVINTIFKDTLNVLTSCSVALGFSLGITGISFIRKSKLVKDDLKGIAKLMYQDVSDNYWDKRNLTKKNLDFSIESIRYIDMYATRLMNTETGIELLNEHLDNLVLRIVAYIGEVIKGKIKQDFYWYEFDSVNNHSSILNGIYSSFKPQTVLYSKKSDVAISPLLVVSQFLEGKSNYPNFLIYVEKMVWENS